MYICIYLRYVSGNEQTGRQTDGSLFDNAIPVTSPDKSIAAPFRPVFFYAAWADGSGMQMLILGTHIYRGMGKGQLPWTYPKRSPAIDAWLFGS